MDKFSALAYFYQSVRLLVQIKGCYFIDYKLKLELELFNAWEHMDAEGHVVFDQLAYALHLSDTLRFLRAEYKRKYPR